MDQEQKGQSLISICNCSIQDRFKTYIKRVDWEMKCGQAWLVTGPNGGGKEKFVAALCEKLSFVPNPASPSEHAESGLPFYSSVFTGSTASVSLEEAAALIQEERDRDESEILDHEDIGRTGRQYIAEVLGGSSKKNAPLPPEAARLEFMPQVKLCGVEGILDRGLRYMSTGEIRRTLLCRALLSKSSLLVLSDPFAGLDAASRSILLEFFDTITQKQLSCSQLQSPFPRIILSMERFTEVPQSISHVIEFKNNEVSFCGRRADYENLLAQSLKDKEMEQDASRKAFLERLDSIRRETQVLLDEDSHEVPDELISFTNVNVGWGDHKVLVDLNWTVRHGMHYLIQGPNGSGKTTILELITGDNMQVFREDIKLFGRRRGSGETIWDIKKRLGIVSYRLHVEYRMVGGTELAKVIISGFHDSIGLYEQPTDYEIAMAKAWLDLAGFGGRENKTFNSLSYGEQRCVLILRAAVKSPRVLILDEPCHGLDEESRARILSLLEKIGETGTTTLLHVTHDPSEVLPCEKHILELRPGQTPMYALLERE